VTTSQPTASRSIQLSQVEELLDVVFGVVIGLALTEMPGSVESLATTRNMASAVPTLLLMSGLLFSAFYWLETRFFISAQERFDRAIRGRTWGRADGVSIPLGTFVVGTLAMMALAAGVLAFAAHGRFRLFLAANIAFWLFDFLGAIVLKRSYKPHRQAIEEEAAEYPEELRWFRAHIQSGFFYTYALLNLACFGVLLIVDLFLARSELYRLIAAIVLLIVTLVRHLLVRSVVLERWVGRDGSTVVEDAQRLTPSIERTGPAASRPARRSST